MDLVHIGLIITILLGVGLHYHDRWALEAELTAEQANGVLAAKLQRDLDAMTAQLETQAVWLNEFATQWARQGGQKRWSSVRQEVTPPDIPDLPAGMLWGRTTGYLPRYELEEWDGVSPKRVPTKGDGHFGQKR